MEQLDIFCETTKYLTFNELLLLRQTSKTINNYLLEFTKCGRTINQKMTMWFQPVLRRRRVQLDILIKRSDKILCNTCWESFSNRSMAAEIIPILFLPKSEFKTEFMYYEKTLPSINHHHVSKTFDDDASPQYVWAPRLPSMGR